MNANVVFDSAGVERERARKARVPDRFRYVSERCRTAVSKFIIARSSGTIRAVLIGHAYNRGGRAGGPAVHPVDGRTGGFVGRLR